MADNAGPICPNCRSCEIIPLLSALPGFPPYDTVDLGRLPVAQCVGNEDKIETEWQCADCGHKWGEVGERRKAMAAAASEPDHITDLKEERSK